MYDITFTNGPKKLLGYEVTWNTLKDAVDFMGGDIEEHFEDTRFIEVGMFHGVFLKDDFDFEKVYALSNGMILTAGELLEKGYDWS